MKLLLFTNNNKKKKNRQFHQPAESETFRASSASSFGNILWHHQHRGLDNDRDGSSSTSDDSELHPLDRTLRRAPELQQILQAAAAQEQARNERRQRWRSLFSFRRSTNNSVLVVTEDDTRR
eukprot:CAMPEP_0168816818 /NCGR_PEP_ID=MMETSP0726-20121227/6916_1 /TAXON_ID=265536 /ORGANISM="Amphiprora sp., Strain CCMP467" /LENGTH=121 /DNA_ID=CAMNT_0008869083 /DNA_START=43 /DNA_END=408 /DNA_ORIENTATION=+